MGVSINDLSFELIDLIVSCLDPQPKDLVRPCKPKLARYATVSRYFQYAVESRVFYSLTVNSEGLDDLPVLTPSRIAAICSLRYGIAISPFPRDGKARRNAGV